MVLSNIARMLSAECRFYFDEESRDQIFAVIRGAREWLWLVSPYNKHPKQLRDRLTEVIKQGVRVTMVYRDEKDQREGVTYLEQLGARVLPIEWLHSKIYMNESVALASSMNLLDSSFNNSSEFCIRIDKANANGGRLYDQLYNYVERIQSRAEQRNPFEPTPAKAAAQPATSPRSPTKATAASVTGYCIRCAVEMPLNPEKPLCTKDYRSWNHYKDPDYKERFCHLCRKEHETSVAKPLCRSCYRASVRA